MALSISTMSHLLLFVLQDSVSCLAAQDMVDDLCFVCHQMVATLTLRATPVAWYVDTRVGKSWVTALLSSVFTLHLRITPLCRSDAKACMEPNFLEWKVKPWVRLPLGLTSVPR